MFYKEIGILFESFNILIKLIIHYIYMYYQIDNICHIFILLRLLPIISHIHIYKGEVG